MTNISKGLNVDAHSGSISSWSGFVSVDDLKKGIDISDGLNLTWKTGTNELYVKVLTGAGITSLKLTAA